MTEAVPDRTCYQCGKSVPDAPLVFHATKDDPTGKQQYHYDCAPEVVFVDHPELAPYREKARGGMQNAELRDHIAANLPQEA